MNNRTNIFRVEHESVKLNDKFYVNVGPYTYFSCCSDLELAKQWEKLTSPHEPINFIPRELGINYNPNPVIVLTLCNRPGPFEDMELRSKMINYMGSITKDSIHNFYLYGFRDIHQYKKWFHDYDETQFLISSGFVLRKYEVKSENMMSGSSQCVIKEHPEIKLKFTDKL